MTGLLADHNAAGHLRRLVDLMAASDFAADWLRMALAVETFESLRIQPETVDRELLDLSRSRGLVLVTLNRNHDGPNSLDAAIRDGRPDALPVLTLADGDRVLRDAAYARAVAIALLDILFDLDDRPETILGSGRIFLPRRPV